MNRSDSCDFCFGPGPFTVFDVPDFEQAVPGAERHVSRGGWLACPDCAELVEARDSDGLVERVVGEYRKRRQLPNREEARMFAHYIRQDYERVFATMSGESEPLEELRGRCEHPQERREMVRKNDRATGGQYETLVCLVCGLEFAEGKVLDTSVERLADGAIRLEVRKRMH
jgi:hypothetical protein